MALRVPPVGDLNEEKIKGKAKAKGKGKEKKWWYCIDGDTSQTTNWKDWWLVFRLKKSVFRVGYGFTWVMVRSKLGSWIYFCSVFLFCFFLGGGAFLRLSLLILLLPFWFLLLFSSSFFSYGLLHQR